VTKNIQKEWGTLKRYAEVNNITYSTMKMFVAGKRFYVYVALQLHIDNFGKEVELTFPDKKFEFDKQNNSLKISWIDKNGVEITKTYKKSE
jgi:hypothetical protein